MKGVGEAKIYKINPIRIHVTSSDPTVDLTEDIHELEPPKTTWCKSV